MGVGDVTATLLLALMLGRTEHSAASWFRSGVELRHDADAAQDAFLRAAESIAGDTPNGALAKARALALAGKGPEAIQTLNAGLKIAPYHRELQGDLRALRNTIRYPDATDPNLRVRPNEFVALRHRVSPSELFLFAGAFGLLGGAGAVRFQTSRSTASAVLAVVGAAGFVAAFALCRWIGLEAPIPLVLDQPATLRTGNGTTYPAKLEPALPAGAELKELGRRGGWVQVELPGGAAGWIPETALIK
jgi:hypothetical protein